MDPVEPVSAFPYLGSTVSQDCSNSAEVSSRIVKASQAFGSLNRRLWLQKRIKTVTMLCMFSSVTMPTLLYEQECTVLLESEIHRIQSFVMHCLRIILSISIWDNKCNTSIQKAAKQQRVSSFLSQCRLRFAGHLVRMSGNRLPRKLLVCSLPSGGQKCRWNDLLLRDLRKIGLGDDWKSKAMDRNEWKWIVRERVESVNKSEETREKKQKDERKRRREGRQMACEAALKCAHPGCEFVALSKAGLTNHTRQKHQHPQLAQCSHCHRTFHRQGLLNHQRFCPERPGN